MLRCSPVEANWNKKSPGKCIGSDNIIYTAAFNVINDIVILFSHLIRDLAFTNFDKEENRSAIGILHTFAVRVDVRDFECS